MLKGARRRIILGLILTFLSLAGAGLACCPPPPEVGTPPPGDEAVQETVTAEVDEDGQEQLESSATPRGVDTFGCTLGAVFEADVSVPDNTEVAAGHPFTKTWQIRNAGSCAWVDGYRWTFDGGEQMGAPDSVPVPETLPGESADISVPMRAPTAEGSYRGYWRMCVNQTECFGDRSYVLIISSAATPTPDPTTTPTATNTPTPTTTSTPTITPVSTPTPLAEGQGAFVNCLECARQSPWLLYLYSEPGGTATVGGLRHVDQVTVEEARWRDVDAQWWYRVEGWDEYTQEIGDTVSGWVPATNITAEIPDQYPLGMAWVEFSAGRPEDLSVPIWDRPFYYNLQGHGVGTIRHGTQVQISAAEWNQEYELWVYEITGPGDETGESITGWLDGIFLVLSAP